MATVIERPGSTEGSDREQRVGLPARVVHTGGAPEADPRRQIPELGFREYWYPLVGAATVSHRKPRMIQMLGDELCVFHGAHGVAAVSNFCPHRGTRLAGGDCHFAGTVTCPYHGFTYDERGECVAALPEGPESRMPGKIRAQRYPTRTLKGIVFVWMGDGEPTPVEQGLPPELFDESMILHDTILWNANWRPALENFQDAHAPYVHRDSIAWVVRPIVKRSFAGARPVIDGGGVPLTYYRDGQRDSAPYQEYFPSLQGYWPKHRWRLLWTPLFGDMRRPHYGARSQVYFEDPEWANGPHMPGMQRIDFGGAMYTRWCVPIDRQTTREFYFLATRPASRWERFRQWATYPVVFRWWQYRNFGLQDDRVLSDTAFDRSEYFSEYDVETIGWRTLAILTAAYGGRHDRIPAEVIEKFNSRALASLHATGEGTVTAGAPAVTRTLIRDATIVTVDPSDTILPRGDLVIDGERLAYVGPPDDARRAERYDRVMDASRHVAMPGLVNAHTHTYATLFKGSYELMPLDLWLIVMRAPMSRVSEEQLRLSALVSAIEMLRTGTTTCLDHFFGNTSMDLAGVPQELAAMDEAGLRSAVAYVLADLKWEDTLPLDRGVLARSSAAAATVTSRETEQGLAGAEAFFETFQGRYPRQTLLVGPSAAHRLSDAMLAGCRQLADRWQIGMHLHCGEEKPHAVQARVAFGTSLVGHLEALGVLGPDVSLAHGVWLGDDEFEIAARRGVSICHNPASNLKLGSGVARVRRALELGVNVAVATDGPCSSDNFNMFEALRGAALLQTSNQVDYREWLSARQALRMGTINAARACNLQDEIGSLEAGKRADVVLLKRDSYALAARNDLTVQLVYAENGSSVDQVFVDGELVVEHGHCTRVDEREVFRQVGAARAALQAGLEAEQAASAAVEDPIREMMERVAGWPLGMRPGAWFA